LEFTKHSAGVFSPRYHAAMSTLSVTIQYRPVRIGFCVQQGSVDDLDRAIRLTHTFWGGRFNPMIPVGSNDDENKLARALTDIFEVDVLYPVSSIATVDAFIKSFHNLPWPKFERELYIDSPRGKVASFIDIYHPVRSLFEEHIKDKPEPCVSPTLYQWDSLDPLKHVLLATFGSYPSRDEIGKDYSSFFVDNLRGPRVEIGKADNLPADAYRKLTPSALTAVDLDWSGFSPRGNSGFYVGDAGSFDDLVSFWNLRAANIDLLFYDLAHKGRFEALKNAYIAELLKRPADPVVGPDRIEYWSRLQEIPNEVGFGHGIIWSVIHDEGIWNGLNVNPRRVYINEQSALASVTDSMTRPSLSFQLPTKPFFDDVAFHQSVMVSVRPLVDLFGQEEFTFRPAHIPELNEYYGREAYLAGEGVRSEADGLGILLDLSRNDLTLRAIPSRELIVQIFRAFGMKAEPSQAGLIASRLIKQMGGLQGCRVFKITGVRNLIEKYSALQTFTRSAAVQIVGQNDPVTGQPKFEDFEKLYIEQRSNPKLTPEQTFKYLVRNAVFRAGLNLACPYCQLDFWLPLDDIATEVRCELCGNSFNITGQLHDRDWAYRRSGLFGREDHQEGSVPVVVTLQQIDTIMSDKMIHTTAMNLAPVTADVAPCETDFVIVGRSTYDRRIPLAIGECKGRKEITEQDVRNLARIADAFLRTRIEPFIVFAKTTSFTQDEIARCRQAQGPHSSRVILLSARELEPYFVYERTEKEFEIRSSAISLEDLARATQNIYFDPKPKVQK
jgi:hypothetical protein